MSEVTQAVTAECQLSRDVPPNWREFAGQVISRIKEERRQVNKGSKTGISRTKALDELDEMQRRVGAALDVARILDGRGPRSGFWIEETYRRSCAVKRVLDAEHGTIAAE